MPAEEKFASYFWKGQKFYKCPEQWESGAPCAFASYDLEEMAEHLRQPHTRDGKPKAGPRRIVSPLVDGDGRPIVREVAAEDLPAEFREARFKP